MQLFGKKLTRRQLEGYTGDLRQIADVQIATLEEGPERGVRVAYVRTGSGLDFTVLLDRAMDIGTTTYNGIPLAWQSGAGPANPSRYEPGGLGWLRTFHGGLLALCGLTHAGAAVPGVDPVNKEILGIHGRIGTIPTRDVSIWRGWQGEGDDEHWSIQLRGTVDEVVLFGYKLHLERVMTITPGEPTIQIQDRVYNSGGEPAPLMILYHCNFGWPLVSPDSEIISPSTADKIEPRDDVAKPGLSYWNKMQEPTPGFAEHVFWHPVEYSEKPAVTAIRNQTLGLGVELAFDSRTLNYLTEWKQMGYGDYTIGLEPGNCLPIGRVAAREAGTLRMLPPGTMDTFNLSFRVVPLR